jgi:hypothetical protein
VEGQVTNIRERKKINKEKKPNNKGPKQKYERIKFIASCCQMGGKTEGKKIQGSCL